MADTLSLADARSARLVRTSPGALELVGRSAVAARLQEFVRRSAPLDGGVLVVAERGIDAESIARELHARGRPASAPFITIDCGADGLDAALFGERAPGASDLEPASAVSLIANARGGTLFLRDVGDLPAAVQARLARVARDGEVRIDGEASATGIRFTASTSGGIDADVRDHRFRADLYRRLSASRIDLPPLRDRAEDVPAMAVRLLEDACAQRGAAPRTFSPPALALVGALPWPGNAAELRDVIERVVDSTDASDAQTLHVEHLLPALPLERASQPFTPAGTLREARVRFERDYIAAVLQHHGWRMADAAATLGIQRPNLYRKARQLGIPVARATES
jgi:DNA-binding NtrC family response regulator